VLSLQGDPSSVLTSGELQLAPSHAFEGLPAQLLTLEEKMAGKGQPNQQGRLNTVEDA
jgi:hypothetical protein